MAKRIVMKHISFVVALTCVLLSSASSAFAKQGDSCNDPIPLGKDYSATITKPQTVWYSANTFDLPLAVYFKTTTSNQPPIVEMDFTCTPGIYTDSILCSLFCKKTGSGGIEFDMPHKPELKVTTLDDGSFAYYIAMGKTYRDLLLQMGIDYNVVVYIKVTYKSTGTMTMTPDAFGNCMDGGKFMHVGDTIRVNANDVSRHVIVPYIQWMEDSIRYVWNGTAPLQLSVATDCDFDPDDNTNPRIANFEELQPKDTFKLTSEQLKYYVNGGDYSSEAGMFFAKWHTTGTGILKIERVPQAPPRGGATLLRYNRATDVTPSDTLVKTYAIPYTWTTDTKFTTPTDHVFKLYVGTDPDFLPQQAIASYQFFPGNEGHWLGLYAAQLQQLWTKTTEQYLYIKIWCTAKTTITPLRWYPSDCADNDKTTYLPPKNDKITVGRKETTVYRLLYDLWRGGDITLQFSSNSKCQVFIADTCKISTTNTSASNLINNVISLQNRNKRTITAATIESWAPRVIDEDGFIYIRFYTEVSGGGTITLTTATPEEQDPAPIVYPATSLYVACGDKDQSGAQNVTIKVSVEQDLTIYDSASTQIADWHQNPTDAPYSIKLNPGAYTLVGKSEKVEILIKK